MTDFFTAWGTACARYPVPVMVLGVCFALGLSTGVQWLRVETDPVELWAAPLSRSRVEKDYYDRTFRPFYRTAQVIVHARGIGNVSSSSGLILFDFSESSPFDNVQFCFRRPRTFLAFISPLLPQGFHEITFIQRDLICSTGKEKEAPFFLGFEQ